MEIAEGQRFPRNFVNAISLLGGSTLVLSLCFLPFAQIGFPLFLLTLIATCAAARFDDPDWHHYRWRFPVANAFALLAMLLFDGESAILLATVGAFCNALRPGQRPLSVIFKTALATLSTFVLVWTLRLTSGGIPDLARRAFTLDAFDALCVAVFVQALFSAAVVALGGSFKIAQPIWRALVSKFVWTYLSTFAAAGAAALAATLVFYLGINISIAVGSVAGLILFAASRFFGFGADEHLSAKASDLRDRNANDTSERFRSAFDYAAIGMALVSTEGRWLQVNRSLCQILGYTEQELLATDFLTITHPDDLGAALANIGQLLRGRAAASQMEKRYINKSGQEVWVHWSVSLARDTHGQSVHFIFQIQDITDRRVAEQQLHHDAFHDALTGLPNRALFMDHLKLAIARSQRAERKMFAVLYLDLDRFKVINDSLGHTIGDQLLIGIAERLKLNLRPGDTVARLGGDEFTILIEDIMEEKEAIQVVERIQKELSSPFALSGREVFTTVSMGIAPSSTGYDRPDDILRDADTAMYRAKSMGKARYEIFDKAMHARAINLLQLETDMRRALERDEFLIHYQPIVALKDFRLCGFEALVRWQHPERGFISPMDFIPVAEETGMIIPLGEWVLREACRQMNIWQTMFPVNPPLFMSVNLSSKQFSQSNLINNVAYILDETGIYPTSLKLEITESVVMENIEVATEMLRQLRALGVQLSIDDFGTGYSSLSYLHRFPIDTLKIDRSFVSRMSENNENTEIVRTIVVLAQNLGMDVVAEGVETNEQLMLLKKLGCENGQGYFFSRPVNSEGAERIIKDAYASLVTSLPQMSANTPGENALVA